MTFFGDVRHLPTDITILQFSIQSLLKNLCDYDAVQYAAYYTVECYYRESDCEDDLSAIEGFLGRLGANSLLNF